MSAFEIIVSVVSVVGVAFGIWTSKWCTRRRIERKQRRIQWIDTYQFQKYGCNKPCWGMTKLDWKKKKLQEEIEELHKDL